MNRSSFHARHEGLVDVDRLERSRVLVIGAGSLGSAIAVLLVRSGIRAGIRICDMDEVSESNLCRAHYVASDVGTPKVDALARHLRAIRPDVRVHPEAVDVRAPDNEVLLEWIDDADLVIAVTDAPAVQGRIGALAYHRVPTVFAGVYERGVGGEVLFTLPDETPCYDCVLGAVRGKTPSHGHPDYGVPTGQLASEPALGVDALRVAVAATKVALGLLLRGTDARAADIVDRGRSVAFVGNDVAWSWQAPMETLWGRAERQSDCICRIPLGGSTASLASDVDPDGLSAEGLVMENTP